MASLRDEPLPRHRVRPSASRRMWGFRATISRVPTYGWVREGEEERYWAAVDERLTGVIAAPQVFVCPFCHREWPTSEERMLHVGEQHPVGVPLVSVNGRLLTSEVTLRREVAPGDVLVENVTDITAEVDGEAPSRCTVEELRRI